MRDGRSAHLPLIVCLEEAEGLLRGRGESDGSGHLFDRALSLFLQKTDSLESASTHRPVSRLLDLHFSQEGVAP